MLEVILKQEVVKLGLKGDIVSVAEGFARNYLFPNQLAIPATHANRKQIDQMKASAEREAARLVGDAQKLGSVLEGLRIRIEARAGEADQLFGSITARDIVSELKKLDYSIDRHRVLVSKPIRTVGEHDVTLHLHRDVDVSIKVEVVAEGQEDESVESKNVPRQTTEEQKEDTSEDAQEE